MRPGGHLRCRACERAKNTECVRRYRATAKGREANRRVSSSTKRYLRKRGHELALARQRIVDELERLTAEEAECRTKLELLTRTK